MRYSLSSRFRGTLLGAVVGMWDGKVGDKIVTVYSSLSLSTSWELLAVSSAQSLIRMGRFDLESWRDAMSSTLDRSSNLDSASRVYVKAIISTLPIILFYHENQIKLRQNLQNFLATVGQDNPVSQDGALAVGYAIAVALTEKLHKATLIPQIIAFIGSETHLTQQLAQVQTLLEQGAGLERAITRLSATAGLSTSIALAFYCFLSTIEDVRLSVMRATQCDRSQEISAITGALSGAYNSTSGISAPLRMALSGSYTKSLAAWGMKSEAEMLKLSDSLVEVWSGVYEATSPDDLTPVAAIAAPNVIRL